MSLETEMTFDLSQQTLFGLGNRKQLLLQSLNTMIVSGMLYTDIAV